MVTPPKNKSCVFLAKVCTARWLPIREKNTHTLYTGPINNKRPHSDQNKNNGITNILNVATQNVKGFRNKHIELNNNFIQ